MLSGRRFHFRPVLTICAAIGMALLVALGSWQLHRLEWKRDLVAKVESRIKSPPIPFEDALRRAEAGEDMEYTPVYLSGRHVPREEARVFGSYEGAPGHYFFTPLQTASDDVIYVNLGFAPQTADEFTISQSGAGSMAEIAGLFRTAERVTPPASWFRTTDHSLDGLWFIRDPVLFAEHSGLNTLPYYIDSFAVEGRAWPRGGTTRLAFNNRHFEYALTWFGLAATLLGVWLVFSLPRR